MIRQIIRIIFFLFCLLPSIILPQKISEIKISGNSFYSEKDFINWSGLKKNSDFKNIPLDSASAAVLKKLSDNGFIYSDVKSSVNFSPDSQSVAIFLNVDEGKRLIVRDVILHQIEDEDSADINENFEFLINSFFNKNEIEKGIEKSLDYFENNGFPFAEIQIESVVVSSETSDDEISASLHLQINRDIRSRIDRIEVAGNKNTEDQVIFRNIKIKPGEIYRRKKIEEIPRHLNKLRFFDPVEIPSYYFTSKDEGVLAIRVNEINTNNFDGIIGYVPDTGGEGGYLTGLINVSLRNILGTGRAAAIRWEQENRYSQELELKYHEPWIFGFPFNISGGLYQRKQDTTYVKRELNGSLEFLASEDISAALLVGTSSSIPTENADTRFSVFNSTSYSTGISLTIDTRDDFYAPRSGIFFMNSYRFSRKKINGPAEFISPDTKTKINLQILEVDFSGFYELFRRQIIALGIHGKELRGDFFELSDLFRLGGTNSLRGYRENQFLGNRIFWSNLEYRFLLAPRSFLLLFFDTGYFLRNEDAELNIPKVSDFNTGYGFGLNIQTGVGVLRVSYAIPSGDPLNEGKIHFGILNEF